jgi:hypothetical protein
MLESILTWSTDVTNFIVRQILTPFMIITLPRILFMYSLRIPKSLIRDVSQISKS